jgi:hypothetical protein
MTPRPSSSSRVSNSVAACLSSYLLWKKLVLVWSRPVVEIVELREGVCVLGSRRTQLILPSTLWYLCSGGTRY